jgi:SNF2 family DNA or RNA helicase
MISQPKGLNINLYEHQLISIQKMEKLELDKKIIKEDCIKEVKLGINSDPTGYGKTLSTIGLLIRDKMDWNLSFPYIEQSISFNSNLIKTYKIKRMRKLNCNLILVSTSLVEQWKKELNHSKLKVAIVNSKKKIENVDPEDYDVIIVTPSMYNHLVRAFSKYAWKRFIFDEPANIRVTNMKKVFAGFYWFITATPYEIWNKHANCRNSFIKNIIAENYYDFKKEIEDLIIKNDLEFVKKSFSMPKTIHIDHMCSQPVVSILSGMVSDKIKTMLSAGNVGGVISLLGGESTDNVIELIKKKKIASKISAEKALEIYKAKNRENMVKSYTQKLEKLEKEISTIEERYSKISKKTCSICLEKVNNPVLEYNCENIFCSECLLTWLAKNDSCPLCKKTIDLGKLVYIRKDKNDSKEVGLPRKVDMVLKLLKTYPKGQFLIYSQYNSTFNLIEETLSKNFVEFIKIQGSSKTRSNKIEKFKNNTVRVIFLNSDYDGSGLNLQEATDIILYHEMSESIKTQILGRARRIGRAEELRVHHLKVSI